MNKSLVTIVNDTSSRRSIMVVELKSDAEAIAFAEHLAGCTERTVIAYDADGEVLHITIAAYKN